MRCMKNSVYLETLDSNGEPYYKVASDQWGCLNCPAQVFIPAERATAEHISAGYDRVRVDRTVVFL